MASRIVFKRAPLLLSNVSKKPAFSLVSSVTQKISLSRAFSSATKTTIQEPIETIKRDVLKLIQDEVKHLTAEPSNSAPYLAETDWKIEAGESSVTMKKTQDQIDVLVLFDLPKEADEEALADALNAEEEPKEDEQKQEGEAESEQDENRQMKKLFEFFITFSKIPIQGRSSKLHLTCALANDFRVYIESLRIDESQRKLFLEDLNEELRERLYDYFGSLGVDDRLGSFILDYREEFKINTAAEVLQHVHGFLEKSSKQK